MAAMTITTTSTCAHCSAMFTYERVKKERKYCSASCRHQALVPSHRRACAKYDAAQYADLGSSRHAWLSANAKRLKAYKRKHYDENKALYVARAVQHAASNPEAVKAAKTRYAATPRGKDKALESTHRRRARVVGARGTHTRAQFRKLAEFYGHKCLCCGEAFSLRDLEADHVVPIAMGGDNTIFNLQPLCQPCNRRKSGTHADYRPTWENYL